MQRLAMQRIRVGLLAALFGAGAIPLTSPRTAAQTPPKVFSACFTVPVGTVYLIKEPRLLTRCFNGSVPIQWTDGVNAVRTGDAAGGDLAGTYPNPSVAKLQGSPVSSTAPTSGQTLIFNGTAWTPAAPPSAGVTAHGALTGLLNDDHPQYVLADGVRSTVNGFAVTGTLGTGTTPVSGEGTRLMWFPGKAALRAGMLDQSAATAWDNPNVGAGSFAAGLDVTASGQGSQAMGGGATASGFYSRAFGSAVTASGDYATAIGPNSTASGNSSTAIGFLATATGSQSVAVGERVTASGANSTALGYNASTNDEEGSFVYGDHTFAGVVEASAPNQFVVRATGGVQLRTHNTLLTGCNLASGSGSWDCTSSVTLKTDFEPVNGEAVLARVRQLPVERWSYKTEPGVRHLGTFAEDFRRAFGLGTGETTIGLLDMDGVNLAAIQALERRTQDLREEVRLLRAQLADLLGRLERLERASDR